MLPKALKFIRSSIDDLRNFPEEARRAAGFELRAIQNGLEPKDWKGMQSIDGFRRKGNPYSRIGGVASNLRS